MFRPLLVVIAFLVSEAPVAQDPALLPMPVEVTFNSERFPLDGPICAEYRKTGSKRLYEGFERYVDRMARVSGLTLAAQGECKGYLVFNVEREGELVNGVDESYRIDVTADTIFIDSPTDIGAIRALSTLYQMQVREGIEFGVKGGEIVDSPRFQWRGLLIDVCRHFISRETILRQLDGMELTKMNVLHLHLTEDQGFRIESKRFPELHQQGSNGRFLTQADIKVIIREASLRGIRVIPEFDMPGHTTSWFVSHPELASAPGPYTIETGYGVFDPTMDPTREETYQFLSAFFEEMAGLFEDEYMHVGGDENNGVQWKASASISAFMEANGMTELHDLHLYFNKRLADILAGLDKKMIGWDEILSEELPETVLIQSWRGKDGLLSAVRSGRESILSNGWYIDLCQTAEFHYLNDPVTAEMGLTEEESRLVLGGEATMWAELVDDQNIDTRIWPRTAAIAERLWSHASVNDVANMYQRLDAISWLLDRAGLRHVSAQYDLMRLMSESDDVRALKKRVDVIAPVKGYERHRLAVHTTLTPLTNLADIAVPDPAYVRHVNDLISEHFATRNKLTESQLLGELRMLSRHLKSDKNTRHLPEIPYIFELLDFAIDAVYVVNGSTTWDAASIERVKELLELSAEPFSECELALLQPLDRLFQAAITKSE